MVRKLFLTGNTLAVAIPRAAAEAVGLQGGDYVEIECDPDAGAILVWPRDARQRLGLTSQYVEMVGEFLRDYGDALAALDAR
jgi:antitoxin component of MazEF toxin-antitoxin module